ncbi:MAG: DNA polymerase domain-containing protein, partial [Candidatus Diapherotrites archaeon]|nr:DNA polymerase domain-containing protein [Candidatus Diapherotrites archaeon]
METLSPGRFSDPKKDPILMISFVSPDQTVVLSYGKKFSHPAVKCFETEKEMIAGFIRLVKESDLDIIVTYNGDSFDFPYLKERADRFGLHLNIASDETEPRAIKKGKDNAVKLHGMQHLDAYRMLLFLNRFAVVSLIKFDLESVATALFNEKKVKLLSDQINEIWGSGKGLDELANYCKEDSETALRISEQYLPLLVELCKLVRLPLFEVGRGNASTLVEYLLMAKCAKSGTLTANKPSDSETQQRLLQMYKGGYVKEPLPGLHDNIAVLDFSSLYPTIIISHNISIETVNCGHAECREKNSAPNKQWFCTKKKGMISSILQELFEKRMRIKKQLKQETGEERLLLNAR